MTAQQSEALRFSSNRELNKKKKNDPKPISGFQSHMYEKEKDENSCTFSSQQIFATWFRNATVTMWGINSQDRTAMAELAVAASINELSYAEQETKDKLQDLVKQVKMTQKSVSAASSKTASVQQALMKSRALRKTLTTLAIKKNGMENHLEKLRQSKINQSMISSMQATNDALAKLGVNVSDADDVMLDYEDLSKEVHDTTSALSTFSNEYDDEELEQELEMMLGEDTHALLYTKINSKPAQKTPTVNEPKSVELELVPVSCESEANDNDPPDDNVGAAEVVMEQLKPEPNVVNQKKKSKVRKTLKSVDDVHNEAEQIEALPA